jgi:hypothetical protein
MLMRCTFSALLAFLGAFICFRGALLSDPDNIIVGGVGCLLIGMALLVMDGVKGY